MSNDIHSTADSSQETSDVVDVASAVTADADAGTATIATDVFPPTVPPATADAQPKKKKSSVATKIVSLLLLLVGVGLIVAAVFMFGKAQIEYASQEQVNEKLAAYANIDDETDEPPVVDWAGLKAINPDVVGWIEIPGTVINYPVFQSTDNDYYLNHNADGSYGVGGQIFLDFENQKPGMIDYQTLLYGHHLKNGSMFKQIADMDKQQLFDSIDTIWYCTESANYKLRPIFLYYTTGDDVNVRTFQFENTYAFDQYLIDLLGRAQTRRADADKVVAGISKVLTMSTCNYIEGAGRTELVCGLADEIEALSTGSKGPSTPPPPPTPTPEEQAQQEQPEIIEYVEETIVYG